jgi:hypothetical protein
MYIVVYDELFGNIKFLLMLPFNTFLFNIFLQVNPLSDNGLLGNTNFLLMLHLILFSRFLGLSGLTESKTKCKGRA